MKDELFTHPYGLDMLCADLVERAYNHFKANPPKNLTVREAVEFWVMNNVVVSLEGCLAEFFEDREGKDGRES